MQAAELAEKLGCAFYGPARNLTGANTLDAATETDLAFVQDRKRFGAAQICNAGCLIAPFDYTGPAEQSTILTESPRALFAAALQILFPPRVLHPGVHASAYLQPDVAVSATAEIGAHCTVDRGSVIGSHTRLGPGCHIGRNVHIGSQCTLHAAVVIHDGTRIGDRVVLHSGCVLGADGFGFTPTDGRWVKFPQVGIVEIEDDVEIGANSCVDRAALGRTRIGAGTKLDNMVHVGHHCDVGRNVVIAAQTGLSGGVVIGDGAIIGGQVGIGDKARIEPGAVVGSGSGILTSKIVRAGEPVWGTPARPLKQYLRQLAVFSRSAKRR